MKPWQTWILLSLLGLISLGLVRSLLDRSMGKPQAFKFPAQVPLAGWQVINNQLIADREQIRTEILSSQRYQYRKTDTSGLTLTAEARYFVPRRLPIDTKELLNVLLLDQKKVYQALPFKLTEHEFQPSSFYSQFTYQQRAYLTGCIDPSGRSTTNLSQFRRNRLDYDLVWDKILRWPFSSSALLDQRCVWSQLSMPIKVASPGSTEQILAIAWIDWIKWWQANYPDR
jgi:cyanosortase A-associated protein